MFILGDVPGRPRAEIPGLPMQGAWVLSLVRELDPACHSWDLVQPNKLIQYIKLKKNTSFPLLPYKENTNISGSWKHCVPLALCLPCLLGWALQGQCPVDAGLQGPQRCPGSPPNPRPAWTPLSPFSPCFHWALPSPEAWASPTLAFPQVNKSL